ncbi:MAG: Transcriptional regulator, AcrR family [uncultured Sphingomonadaceae bacterium]|uniref:Transcriptional regulator, AcrR family n=1 Tax=uncultured Sphingomonadaceae bacterium TaxID=169976 RepID=A0A6J4SE07_9SPHN|nr:MAG: Transcriptional regulator, AcrR family [uncultured Sphingomonadaceae bacterium]
MRYSDQHKPQTRSRIVTAAARQLRIKGPDQLGVAAVMADAGLTHGGFYAHFGSKDDLIAEAVDAMFDDARRQTRALDDALADETADLGAAFRAYLTSYLSPEHRDQPERGCPLPALSSDMARVSGVTRARFVQGVDKLASKIEAVMIRLGVADPRAEAHGVLAAMIGSVGMSRAVGKGPLSDAVLRDTLQTLIGKLGL